jgi:NADH:ubiquinone reductase (H+-translocating)
MKKVIIIGAGFAGLSAARKLSRCGLKLEITLFDKKERSDFLPLIPDCIGRNIKLEFLTGDIARFCRKLRINFIKEEVISVDLESRRVFISSADYAYDYLVIASGSQTNFFSNPDAQNYAYALNNVNQVKKIIEGLKSNRFDNFIICGGGYTGIEIATNLGVYFKKANLGNKIIIVERAPGILGPLPEWMKSYVTENIKSMGIEVLTNSVIENIGLEEVSVSGGRVFKRSMLIWVPGVKTAEFIQKLNVPKNPQGRIVVDEYLRVRDNCFCAGDTAFFGSKNNFLRMAVQFAIIQGDQAAKNIIRSIKNMPLRKYRPLDLGYIIPMANNRSCGQVLGLNVTGYLATFLHFSMCIFRAISWKNRWGLICNLLKSLPVGRQGGDRC